MKKIDHATATAQNEFTEGNPQTGTLATRVAADWLNVTQAELVNVVEAGGETLDQTGVDRTQLLDAINALIAAGQTDGVPVGTPLWWPVNSEPAGFLVRDGSLISRTTYSDLFAVIGTEYGAGDGSTTFQLPDDRGQFIRGWDDGAGIDSGRVFGSLQTDEFKSHDHTQNASGSNNLGSSGSGTYMRGLAGGNQGTSGVFATGGDETRPKNRAYLPIIKF